MMQILYTVCALRPERSEDDEYYNSTYASYNSLEEAEKVFDSLDDADGYSYARIVEEQKYYGEDAEYNDDTYEIIKEKSFSIC